MEGKIEKLDKEKKYGFISTSEFTYLLYFKIPASLKAEIGDEVFFETERSWSDSKKQMAINVRKGGSLLSAKSQGSGEDNAYYLPADTSSFLAGIINNEIENAALKSEKFIPRAPMKITQGIKFSKREKDLVALVNGELRKLTHDYSVVGTLKSRMVLGLGSASVFETGIILHKPYGFPYIPGSSIKGAIRSFLAKNYSDQFDVNGLFGTQERKGSLTFFDAYPAKMDKLEQDIMNPHFSDWYSGKTAPTDDGNPVPVVFLAVPAGTQFIFRINGNVDEPFKKAFGEMLEYAGLGAKTAVGYGWMKIEPYV
jgi:CRISPR-associated protein Cmr6